MISQDEGQSREELDKFGMWSMQKAVEAQRRGWYADHIIPYEFTHEDAKFSIETDETLRPKAVDDPRVNPTGGAIALGHPIGASGVIYFGEMVHHLKRTGGKAGIQMMCGGGGIGIATVVEAV